MSNFAWQNFFAGAALTAVIVAPAMSGAGVEAGSLALNIPPGTRSIGMGLTGTADAGDVANEFHNPAALAFSNGIQLTGGHNNWKGDLNQFDFALSTSGAIASSRFQVGGGLFHSRTESRERVGNSPFKVAGNESFMRAVMAGVWSASERLNVGIGAAIAWSTGNVFETGALCDVGAIVSGTLIAGNRLVVDCGAGISGRNIGGGTAELTDTSGTTRTDIDERIYLGINWCVSWRTDAGERLRLAINTDAFDDFEGPAVGAELTVLDALSLRGGYHDSIFRGKHASTVGAGFERRVDFFTFRFDYAFAESRDGSWHFNAMGTSMSFDI